MPMTNTILTRGLNPFGRPEEQMILTSGLASRSLQRQITLGESRITITTEGVSPLMVKTEGESRITSLSSGCSIVTTKTEGNSKVNVRTDGDSIIPVENLFPS